MGTWTEQLNKYRDMALDAASRFNKVEECYISSRIIIGRSLSDMYNLYEDEYDKDCTSGAIETIEGVIKDTIEGCRLQSVGIVLRVLRKRGKLKKGDQFTLSTSDGASYDVVFDNSTDFIDLPFVDFSVNSVGVIVFRLNENAYRKWRSSHCDLIFQISTNNE